MNCGQNSIVNFSFLLIFASNLLSKPIAETQSKPKQSSTVDNRGYIVKTGDPSPDFILEFPDGSSTSLEQLKGNVVMLQFTASWCSVCREEMPHIEKDIWRLYRKAGLKLIGIDRDEPADIVTRFAKEMKISYPLALDLGANIFYKFAEEEAGVTRNIIINPEGQIVFLTRLFEKNEFEEMIRVIHFQLVKNNNSEMNRLENQISELENDLKFELNFSPEKYKKKRSLFKLKHEMRKVNRLQSFLNRIKPN